MTATSSEPFSLEQQYPEIAAEWDDEKNVSDITKGSKYKVQWKCSKGHTWKANIANRVNNNTGCPYCSNNKVLKGFNDLTTTHPELSKEWNHSKNEELSPSDFVAGSGKKAWWSCKKNHTWEAVIRSRAKNNKGCPVCYGRTVQTGYNDLKTKFPNLAQEWDSFKNDEKDPSNVLAGGRKDAWWKCLHGHTWKMRMDARTQQGQGCPYCSGYKVLKGYNDLEKLNPVLSKEWDDIRDISTVTTYSQYKAQWKCSYGHIWEAHIYSRADGKQGCPYCSGRRVITGETDLKTLFPELIKEWDDKADASLLSRGSSYKAQWKCPKEHVWEAVVNSRTGTLKTGCPMCYDRFSKPEKELREWIQELLPDQRIYHNDRTVLDSKELDIYIPNKNIAIEFNGLYWHSEEAGKDKWYHYNKWLKCNEKGIQLITIWEDDYKDNFNLVKQMIAHKLGFSTQEKVYGRKTEIVDISIDKAKKFYTENHIQGFKSGIHLGLVIKGTDQIVAISTWTKHPIKRDVHLERFATSCIVPGGFSKLLKHAVNIFKNDDFDKIVTFSAHDVSDGKLYENNGFVFGGELKPDYSYIVKRKRCHKFGFRLKRFKSDPDLEYIEGYTEKQLAELNGIPKIWDCGKTRYVLNIK